MTTAADPLASYVPNLVRLRLATDPTSPTDPALQRLPAAVLLADISGFTTLTTQLSERGPVGAEELGQLLNDYFGRLLLLIDAHGGEAVKFAGDALLALWRVRPDEDLATAVCRAGQCALAVQAALNGHEVGNGVRLSLHLGIGAGEALALDVGGVAGGWYCLVAGEPVQQSGIALAQAHAGEVVIAPEAWALVRPHAQGEKLATGVIRLGAIRNPLPPIAASPALVPTQARAALDAYLPIPIRARLAAGHAAWLAELRRVSVLFLGLLDFDPITGDVLGQAQTAMDVVQSICDRYDGFIKELVVDDKGATVVALFGLPPQAHEDDAARCVQAAQAAQAALAALGQRTAVGVTTGRAFCGAVGSDLRREYTVVGEVMNLAAGLVGRAAGTILCDEATVAAVHGRLAFEAVPAIQVKGHAELLPVYRPWGPVAEHTAGGGAAWDVGGRPLVGRTTERAALREALAGLRAGTSAVLILEGEAGLGKSHLVQDLLRQAAAQGFPTLFGAADGVEQATPYYAWRPIVGRLLGIDAPGAAIPDARARVLEQLREDPALARLAPLLSSIVAVDLPDTALTGAMTGEVRADNTRDLIVRLLQRAVAAAPPNEPESDSPAGMLRPHVLVLEDAHWLDSASWALTRQVADQVAPLLLVVATRPLSPPLPTDCQRLKDARNTRALQLAGLGADETVALVAQRLGVAALPDPVARLIVERAEGNPFYSEELALALRDGGVITVRDGVCGLAPDVSDLNGLAFPDTVQGVITTRIDRLAPLQQLALKVASVIGRAFGHRMLHDVYPVESDRVHLASELAELERHDLTVQETPEPDLAYLFKHVITQETAYGLLLFAQRRELHREVAEWIERREGGDLAPYYPLLAYHWGRAEVAAKTIDYLELAGEQALRQSACQEAVRFFTEALRLDAAGEPANGRSRRARWERQLGEAHLGLGHLAESREHLQQALSLLGRPVPTGRTGLLASLAGQVLLQTLHRAWPARFVGHSHLNANDLEVARADGLLGEVFYLASDFLPLVHGLVRALNRTEAARPSPELAWAYANASVAATSVPLRSLAETYRTRAVATGRNVADPSALGWALFISGFCDFGAGRWARAQASLEEATEMYERLGDWRRRDEILKLRALLCMHRGDLARAIQLEAECYASALRRGDMSTQACALQTQIQRALAVGQLDEARDLAEDAAALADKTADHLARFWTHGLLAVVRLRRGELVLALEAADAAARLIEGKPSMGPWTRDGYAGAEVYLALWEDGKTEYAQPARQACAAMRRFARVFPIGEAQASLYQGLAEWLSGRQVRARRAWQKGLVAAERLDMPHDQGRLHFEIGRHLPALDPTRRQHLECACALFEHVGATDDLARAAEALGRSAASEGR